jgi:adenylate cyclase
MAQEIERKFRVLSHAFKKGAEKKYYRQGYLSTGKEAVLRVRIADKEAFISIKGANKGIVRTEFEYEIPVQDAAAILEEFCKNSIIEKIRYIVDYLGYIWEVDVFLGGNEGLVIAEIELTHEKEKFPVPEWLGEEVTGDPKYYNSNLIHHPYSQWQNT